MKVLVVEDTVELATLARFSLETAGWEVDTVHDGATAMACVGPEHQLWMVDLGLPDMTGEELVARLRARAELPSTPVIWFTAMKESRVPQGGVGVISKPFDPMGLPDVIRGILGG